MEPESNQQSRVSFSLVKSLPPQWGQVKPSGAGALACLHGLGIPLSAVIPQEGIPAAVEAVRGEVSGEELEAILFIIEVLFDDTVFIPAAGGIEAHLEILVVHGNLVEAEFQIGKYGQIPLFSGIVAQPHVPNLHRVVNGRKQGLLGIDAGVVAKILAVATPATSCSAA